MKIKLMLIAAMLPSCVFGQAMYQSHSTGQRFDQYGRPVPSLEELCREGQMAGGPITPPCGMYDLRFNRQGERLARYHFDKWGYNILDNSVTESDAQRLDTDPAFRSKYIKQHGYEKYKMADASPQIDIASLAGSHNEGDCHAESELAYKVAEGSAKGIPIEAVRAKMTKVLDENHVSTTEFNRHMNMIYRAYAWQKHGYALEQIRDADFQACRGTPVLEVPDIAP